MNTLPTSAKTNIVEQLLKTEYGKADVTTIPANRRPEVISELKKHAANAGIGYVGYKSQAELLLLDLGDDGTIGELLRDYRGNPVQSLAAIRTLEQTKQPTLIARLAPDLNSSEPAESVLLKNEFVVPPYSVSSAQIIRSILTNAPQFGVEVKDWATQLDVRNPEALRSSIREWWKANAEAFKQRSYSSVKPGKPSPTKK